MLCGDCSRSHKTATKNSTQNYGSFTHSPNIAQCHSIHQLTVCRHLHEVAIMGWTAVAVIDFYLKYQDTELLDLFTGPEGVLSHVLFPAPLSQVPYIISHHFSFLCHFHHFSTFFQTLTVIHSQPPPPFVRTMNIANLLIFSVFSILPSLHRMPITLDCALMCLRPHWWINAAYMCICAVVVCESFAGLSWAMIESRRCGFHFSLLLHPPPFCSWV